jgi:outer membrane protein
MFERVPASLAFVAIALAQQQAPAPVPGEPVPVPGIESTLIPPAPGGLSIVQAVQMTIDRNPQLLIQKQQVEFDRGAYVIQAGPFDTNIGASSNQGRNYVPLTTSEVQTAQAAGIKTGSQDINTTTTTLNGSVLFRNGISITPDVQLTRTDDNLTNMGGLNSSQVSVQVTLPLLRNRGRAVVDAQEIAAGKELDASSYDLSQLASQLIDGTVTAYWSYLGALQSLDVYRESEQRGAQLLDNVRELVRADIIARIELENGVANFASRTANRIQAEQAVVGSAQALAVAIGVSADEILSLPAPSDNYPDGLKQPLLTITPAALKSYIQLALSRRADYIAAKVRVAEAQAILVYARNQIKPQLNIVGNMGYAGLQEATRFDKYLSSVFQNIYGPSYTAGLQYTFPLGNHAAKGQLMETEAAVQQEVLHVNDTARQLASNVVTAATGLNSSVLQLEKAAEASASFGRALDGEREKLRFGAASVLDILQTEDRYVTARLDEISARVTYAEAIANFRFATGTYLAPDKPVQSVGREAFYVPLVP